MEPFTVLGLLIGELIFKVLSMIDPSMLILMILATIIIYLIRIWYINPLVTKIRRNK